MELQRSQFEGREGEVFHLQIDDETLITLTLTEIASPDDRYLQQARELGIREPFNMLFSGPLAPFLTQKMYKLQHHELDDIELFLVPVKQDQLHYFYEAVFA